MEIHQIIDDSIFAVSGGAEHDGFSDFVANEHIDWTASNGNNIVLNTGTASITGPDGSSEDFGSDAPAVLTIVGGVGGTPNSYSPLNGGLISLITGTGGADESSNSGGHGGAFTLATGIGGGQSSGFGGDGGAMTITTGAGGYCMTYYDAGDGGALSITSGKGGANPDLGHPGNGGAFSLASGAGGAATAGGQESGGTGGAFGITGGIGGAANYSGKAGGTGGGLTIVGGAGGAGGGYTGGNGGDLIIRGGAGANATLTGGDGGDVFLDTSTKGASASPGAAGRVVFRRAGVEKIKFNNSDGGHLLFADSVRLRFGDGADLSLYHDGSNSYITNATGFLNLVDSGSGIKVGTATSQLLGFYGAAPVNQPDTVADATDAASAITQINVIIDRLQELGLVA